MPKDVQTETDRELTPCNVILTLKEAAQQKLWQIVNRQPKDNYTEVQIYGKMMKENQYQQPDS